jgi:hypothetical protein
VPQRRHHRGRAGHSGQTRRGHGADGAAPADPRADSGVGGQLRADGLRGRRRDGCARTRRARLRVRPQVRPGHPAGGPRRRRAALQLRPLAGLVRPEGPRGHPRGDDQLGELQRPVVPRGGRRRGQRAGAPRPGRQEDHLAAARLGHQPAALLGHADTDRALCRSRTCRSCCRWT